MGSPRVTVVVSTYNRSRLLRCALQTIVAQTYRDFDVWVVGDACTDDSAGIVAAFGDDRLHWTNLETRVGSQSGPNNEGLRRATGDYVAYLGHDDLWFPWHLQALVDTAERTGADFTYGGVVFIGPDGPREIYGSEKTHAQVSVSPPSGWMHRRAIADVCGPWRDPGSEPIGVDVGFQARAFLAGFRFAPTRRASVLKFPSPWWRTYRLDRDFPQEQYLARMTADADRLHGEVLTELALAYARRLDALSPSAALATAFRTLQRRAGDWYGVDRWPLAPYLRWRSRRRRARAERQRGL